MNQNQEIDAAVVQRMVELVRRMAIGTSSILQDFHPEDTGLGQAYTEARAIAALLPKPVDPMLLEARRIVKETLDPGSHARCRCRDEIDAGEWDKGQKVRIALVALEAAAKARGEQA